MYEMYKTERIKSYNGNEVFLYIFLQLDNLSIDTFLRLLNETVHTAASPRDATLAVLKFNPLRHTKGNPRSPLRGLFDLTGTQWPPLRNAARATLSRIRRLRATRTERREEPSDRRGALG